MGGRQYAIGKGRTINDKYYPSFESEAEHLLNDYGCLHFKFSILLGISEPTYSPETLATLKANDNEKVEFEGKKHTKYEASQVQRKLETEIRRQKDRTIIAKAAGDREMREEAQAKINLLTSKYAKFSKAAGLPTKMERARVAGFRNISVKSVDKTAESGIIKTLPLSTYVNSSDILYRNSKNIKPLPNYEDVIIHGNQYGFSINDTNGNIASEYTPRELADILRTDPNYKGGAIRLIACESGKGEICAAQMLAEQLQVEVLAPTDVVWVFPNGDMVIGPTEFEDTGEWKLFKPKGVKK